MDTLPSFNGSSAQAEARLDALNDAIRAVTTGLSLERVLLRLAEIAAHLVNARYAALGVPDSEGGMDRFLTYGMTDAQVAQMDHYPVGRGLLGELLRADHPIRLEEMHHDPRSGGFPAHHPKMHSFLGIPIISKGQHLGSLYLCDRMDQQPFTAADERLINLLAGHAAIAIENARLSEQHRRLAILEERDRIAMELHDGIIQQIYAVGIKLELTRQARSTDTLLNTQLSSATQSLNQVIEDLRRYITDLKSGVDLTLDLLTQTQEIIESFREVCPAELTVEIGRTYSFLTDALVHGVSQLIREALSNITRHAAATRVWLTLHEQNGELQVMINDNGRGFRVDRENSGRGLANMRRRSEQLGGQFTLESTVGGGTRIEWRLSSPRSS
jgi:signal transduction histidine kinase